VGGDVLPRDSGATVGAPRVEVDGGELIRGEIHPGVWLGVGAEVGEVPGIAPSRVEASRVELDEGSGSCAETVSIGAVLVEIDAGGRFWDGAAAGATTGIEVSRAKDDAAGLAWISSTCITSERMPIGIIPLPGKARYSS
jgi:hypothetical protein